MSAAGAAAPHRAGLMAAVAAFGLPGGPAIPRGPLPPDEWRHVLHAARTERIEGLLAAVVASGTMDVDDRQRHELRLAAVARASNDLDLERELQSAAGVLDQAGVGFRVLKGHAWAHTVYRDPSWRSTGDVDLLIDDDGWYRALEALEQAGAHRILPEIRPGFDRRFGRDATLRAETGHELDLHRALAFGPYGLWIDQAELLARAAKVGIGQATMLTLDPEASFIHACLNLVLGDDPPRLIAARDVVEMVSAGRADANEVAALARTWRSEAVIVRAFAAAEAVLGIRLWDQPLAGPFLALGVGPWSRTLMATYRGPARGYSSQAAAVIAFAGARERLAYLRALARPQPAYLAARGVSPAEFLRRGARRFWRRS